MPTLSKHNLTKQAKAIATDTDALKKSARRARKMAQEQAGEARKQAQAWSKHAEKRTRKARKHAIQQADERREELMEKLVAGAGIAMSVAPVVAKAVMSNKTARRRVARTASTTAIRMNPLVLGASLAGAGFVGYKMWKKRAADAKDANDMALDADPTPLQHERMDGEGPTPGLYEPTHLHVSRN